MVLRNDVTVLLSIISIHCPMDFQNQRPLHNRNTGLHLNWEPEILIRLVYKVNLAFVRPMYELASIFAVGHVGEQVNWLTSVIEGPFQGVVIVRRNEELVASGIPFLL